LEAFITNLLYGLTIGSALILVASSLSLIFGILGVINFAHGSMCMLGAYVGLSLVNWTGNFWLALIISPLIVGALGLAIEGYLVKPLYGQDPVLQLLLTFGLAMVFSNVVLHIWGVDMHSITIPAFLKGYIFLADTVYPKFRIFVLFFSAAMALSLWFFLAKTKWGIILRAGIHNKELVESFGIDMSRVFTLVFGIGVALAAVAGVILGAMRNCNPAMDGDLIIGGLIAIVIGGLGSFRGAVLGSLILGLSESFGAQFLPGFAKFSIYIVMVIILLWRPEGLIKTV
jgi:branched-subunit amino acid ABC-type transport system permease component